jgi:hypothetical protein
MPRDDDVITVATYDGYDDEPSRNTKTKPAQPLSKAKLDQLAAARDKALISRRKILKNKLEAKLAELREVLGVDLRNDTLERVGRAMMQQEERLRNKQNENTERLSEAIESLHGEMRKLRREIAPAVHNKDARPRPPPLSTHKVSLSSLTSKPAPSNVSSVKSRQLHLSM